MSSKSKFWALLRRDYIAAADLYFQEGNLLKAADCYARGGNLNEAARLASQAGDADAAVDFFVQAGSPLKAGELLAAADRHKEAVPFFEQARAFWQAAQSSLKLKQPLRAARYFDQAGSSERAAECFEKAGALEEAAKAWDKDSRRHALQAKSDPQARQKQRHADLSRAAILARLGQLEQAAELLKLWGENEQAGATLEKAGKFEQAAIVYLEAERPDRAATLLDRAAGLDADTKAKILVRSGQHSRAAEIYLELGRQGEAAEALEASGDWGHAAEVWENAGDLERAAELYYRSDRLESAARCYARAKKYQLAAETYAKIGDHRSAAQCWTRVGKALQAAKHYLKAGDKTAASGALQNLTPDSEGFEEATLILVPLLVQDGLYEGAQHRLSLLPEKPGSLTMAVERLYWQGRVADAHGDLDEAERSYEKAVSLKRDHRDLVQRLVLVRRRKAENTAATAPLNRRRAPEMFNPGDLLQDRYEIVEEIGSGGMSRVYRAKDRELDEELAIKTLLSRAGDELKSEERLLREVQICRKITHPNVVRVYDIGRFPGGVFVTMELLRGTTLDHIINSEDRLPLKEVKRLMRDILSGLQEAHQLKVIHRDLKPANISVVDERAKIMDFGIAEIEDADVHLTQTGQVIGSPMYMSPEQIQGFELDARTDLYSFGVLTYALLVGHEPFMGKTPTAISLKHLQEAPPSLLEARPDLNPRWQQFISKLLAKKPEDRYPSALDVLEELERLPLGQ